MYAKYFKHIDWQHERLKVEGVSSAGIGTSIGLPEMNICIDVAQGLPFAFGYKNYLITHGHMDHAAGIPYLISQKALQKNQPAQFYMPENMLEPLDKILKTWGALEGHEYKYDFHAVKAGHEFSLTPQIAVKPFETFHRVPSVGYMILDKRKKLKAEFAHLSQAELRALDRQDLTEIQNFPLFAYTGDSKIEFWDANPEVLKCKVLFMEVTYWDQKKSVESAREWGHIHLEEVLPRLKDFQGDKLVFTHISSRYHNDMVRKIIQEKIPRDLQDRVDIFAC